MVFRRKKAKSPVKPGKVHMIFGTHYRSDRLLVSPSDLKASDVVVIENSYGDTRKPRKMFDQLQVKNGNWKALKSKDHFDRLINLLLRYPHGPVYIGESSNRRSDRKKYTELKNRTSELHHRLFLNPSFRSFKELKVATVRFNQFREKLIEETISELANRGMNVLAQYGPQHSTLSAKLKGKFEVSRKIFERDFLPGNIISRKKSFGKKVLKKDLELAWLGHCFDFSMRRFKKSLNLSNRQDGFLFSALLNYFENNNHRQKMLKTIDYFLARTNDEPKKFWKIVVTQEFLEMYLLKVNGLSASSTKKEVLQWLEKHSLQWRRLKAAKRYRNQ